MVSGDDSRSGMCSPKTRSLPRAATQRAATVLESIPPDSATTTPRRLECARKEVRLAVILAVSSSASIRRLAGPKGRVQVVMAHSCRE